MPYKKGTQIANVDWTPDSKQGQAYISQGYTYVPPTQAPAPTPVPTPTPTNSSTSAPKDMSQKTVWKNNKSTIVLGYEVPQYLANGYSLSNTAPSVAAPSAPVIPPPVVITSDTIRADEEAASKPYIQYAGSPDVFNQSTGQHITAEQAAQIPNFWNQVYASNDIKPTDLLTPIQSIQKVFGAGWKPSAAFTPELQAQGIYGAVRVGNSIFTIGPGGSLQSAESFKKNFGRAITDTAGIVGDINYDQAKALGITITPDIITEPLNDISLDPLDNPASNAKTIQEIKNAAEIANGVEKAKEARDKAQDDLIKFIADFQKNLAEGTKKAKEESGVDAASAAIVTAQKAVADLQGQYMAAIEAERGRPQSMASMTGRQARLTSMMAVQLYPLQQAVLIAQGNYTRADDMFDDAMDDWKTGMEWSLKAAQENVDKLGMDLTDAQQKSKDEAQIKIDFAMADYEQKLDTQQEVKKMSLAYPEAKITVGDSWDTAYKKVAPFIKSEADFKKKMDELDLKIKEKSLAKGNGGGSLPNSYKEWSLAGGVKGTGMTYAEYLKRDSKTAVTYESITQGTADYLGELKNKGQLQDDNWDWNISAAMKDAGLDTEDEESRAAFENRVKRLMTGAGESSGVSGENNSFVPNEANKEDIIQGFIKSGMTRYKAERAYEDGKRYNTLPGSKISN